MTGIDRATFDHIGVVTRETQPREAFVEATRVWVTSPRAHAFHVEFLRFADDATLEGPVRTEPHVAFRVLDVEAAIAGHELLLGPFDVGDGFVRVAFVRIDGAVVEFMQYRDPNEEGWFS